ncbi:MAG: hypothetical protein R2726_04890 [Acidimicrobiales bacterium]
MAEDRKRWWERADRAELERRAAEADELAPFLDLAREIRLEVARVVADDTADASAITAAIERIPDQERERVVRSVFARLPVEAQWAVLARAFGDEEIRRYLAEEREERLARLRRTEAARAVAHRTRLERRLDTTAVPPGVDLTLGLFREDDVRAALVKGETSATCARRLVLRGVEPGRFRVIDDVFNPRGGYFVTRDYDEQTWQGERLEPHALIRVGSATGSGDDGHLEPVLYPGGRADVEVDDRILRGDLHVGFVMLDDVEVFAG